MSYIDPLDILFTERYETYHPLPVWFYLCRSNDDLVSKIKEEHRVSFYGTILGHEIHLAADIEGAIKYNGGGPTKEDWCVNPQSEIDFLGAFSTLNTCHNLFGSINSIYTNCGSIAVSLYGINTYIHGSQPIIITKDFDAFVAFVRACLIGQGKDVSAGYLLSKWEALELQDAWNTLQDWLEKFDAALQANRALRATEGSNYDINRVMPLLQPFQIHVNKKAIRPNLGKYSGKLRFVS